jgi:hypothetical protein
MLIRMKSAILLLLVAAISAAASEHGISEESAVAQLKKTPAYRLDGSLPNRPFGSWVNDKFRSWDIQWELHNCGKVAEKTEKRDLNLEGPVCVQVNIMQPGQKVHGEASDGFQLLFVVGTEKRGLMSVPLLHAATRTEGDEVLQLSGLGDVEP